MSYLKVCPNGGHIFLEDMSNWRPCFMARHVLLEDMSYWRTCFYQSTCPTGRHFLQGHMS